MNSLSRYLNTLYVQQKVSRLQVAIDSHLIGCAVNKFRVQEMRGPVTPVNPALAYQKLVGFRSAWSWMWSIAETVLHRRAKQELK